MRLSVLVALAIIAAAPPAKDRCGVTLDGLERQVADVDGDGDKETAIALDCGGTGNCHYLFVVSNAGQCPRLVGEWFGQLPVVQSKRHHGLADLSVFNRSGCAGRSGGLTRLVFDGRTYVERASVSCQCGDEPDAGPRDARCDTRQF
jgi:hypothetical protein